jgi:hypothetical protein
LNSLQASAEIGRQNLRENAQQLANFYEEALHLDNHFFNALCTAKMNFTSMALVPGFAKKVLAEFQP